MAAVMKTASEAVIGKDKSISKGANIMKIPKRIFI